MPPEMGSTRLCPDRWCWRVPANSRDRELKGQEAAQHVVLEEARYPAIVSLHNELRILDGEPAFIHADLVAHVNALTRDSVRIDDD